MPSAAPASPPLYPLSLHAALPICAAQAQRDPARVQGPQRAAGRRLDRARHHQPADRADGARGRRAQGVPGLGRAAGALPEHLRHRRSEEHTSELQSPCNLVCRLLLPRLPRSTLFPYTPLFRSVRRKLNAIPLEFKDRNVLLVDDSIVRGTTSQQIVQMAREAGARKVYLASAAPPVRYPNIYGIEDRKSTRLNSSHLVISYAVCCSRVSPALPSFPTRRSSDLCGASSTRSRSSSRTATCCWSTTRSCAAPPASRSCRWRARPARARCTWPRPRRRCATRTSTASKIGRAHV